MPLAPDHTRSPETPPTGTPPPEAAEDPRERITIRAVTKTFPGMPVPALDGIDLAIQRGSFFTVIGPSGSGKTTLLRVLAGLTPPDAGEVSIFGESPRDASRSKHLGWVPQSPALLPWRSVLDNVRLPLQVNRRVAADRLSGTLSPDGASWPDPLAILARLGLDGAAGLLPAQLSGGMRQRVAIARAFAFAPTVLLMDEPFGALDEMTREAVAHQLLELWQYEQRTVVFVTHSVSEAVILSDKVTVMGEGKLTAPLDVPLPRPRPAGTEDTKDFHELVAELRSQLKEAFRAGPA